LFRSQSEAGKEGQEGKEGKEEKKAGVRGSMKLVAAGVFG
jgi:hypothetical protein